MSGRMTHLAFICHSTSERRPPTRPDATAIEELMRAYQQLELTVGKDNFFGYITYNILCISSAFSKATYPLPV